MTIIEWVVFVSCVASLLIYLLVALSKPSPTLKLPTDLPAVSILISLRNEVENVDTLCQGLQQLDYPHHKLEILIGDDDSQDDTRQMLRKYEGKNIRVFSFGEEQTGHFGKQRVLKKLFKESSGEIILFTDGDMVLQPNWVKGMLPATGVLKVGVTAVAIRSFWSGLQNLDWLLSEWMIRWLAEKGVFLTAWGNNMAIHRNLLDQVGFEDLSESEVEDIALSQALVKMGVNIHICTSANTRLITQPTNVKGILHQRLRWMKGVKKVPSWLYLTMALRLCFLPFVIYLIQIHWLYATLIGIKLGLHSWFLGRADKRKTGWSSFLSICFYDLYEILLYFFSFVAHIFRVRFDWKGRVYK